MGFLRRSGGIGIEIDTGAVRAVELRVTRNGPVIVSAGQSDLPEEAVIAGLVEEVDTVGAAIQELWSSSSFSRRNVVLGVANQGMFMRSIRFPHVPEEKLGGALRLQAGEYLPISPDQLVMDHAVLDEFENEDGDRMYEILLVAEREERLQKSLDALDAGGLNPSIVDASPLALVRNLPEEALADSVILVDVGNGVTSLLVVSDGEPVFARISPVGLHSLTDELGCSLGDLPRVISGRSAGAFEFSDEDRDAAINRWVSEMAQEIRSSVNYHVSQSSADVVESLVLTGRGARLCHLDGKLSEHLEVAVTLLNPMESMPVRNARGVDPAVEGPDYAVAMGLAHRALEEVR